MIFSQVTAAFVLLYYGSVDGRNVAIPTMRRIRFECSKSQTTGGFPLHLKMQTKTTNNDATQHPALSYQLVHKSYAPQYFKFLCFLHSVPEYQRTTAAGCVFQKGGGVFQTLKRSPSCTPLLWWWFVSLVFVAIAIYYTFRSSYTVQVPSYLFFALPVLHHLLPIFVFVAVCHLTSK